jgi:hypothetical protein
VRASRTAPYGRQRGTFGEGGPNAVEPETGAALNAALAAGEPTKIDYRPSFVDGSGSPR